MHKSHQIKKINYIFLLLGVFYAFFSVSALSAQQNSITNNYSEIIDTYGKNNLASKAPFKGGYINFGYWKDIVIDDSGKEVISSQDRVKASFGLYKLIIDNLALKKGERVLEAGCGLGYGCEYVAKNYPISGLTCVDITPQQIERAKNIHKEIINKSNVINFEVSSADNINKPDSSYDKIYSVEAAQYFPSMTKFAKEAHRLLKPKGLLVITAHFSTNENGYEAAKNLLPTVAHNVDLMIPVDKVRNAFIEAGFTEIKTEKIGQNVFKGFDRWISQVEDAPWAHNIYQLYLDGHIDYYVFVLQKG